MSNILQNTTNKEQRSYIGDKMFSKSKNIYNNAFGEIKNVIHSQPRPFKSNQNILKRNNDVKTYTDIKSHYSTTKINLHRDDDWLLDSMDNRVCCRENSISDEEIWCNSLKINENLLQQLFTSHIYCDDDELQHLNKIEEKPENICDFISNIDIATDEELTADLDLNLIVKIPDVFDIEDELPIF